MATFGLTHSDITSQFFPAQTFGASTKPTSTAVGVFITRESAKLTGALAAKGVSATTIINDAGSSYPNAYAWCQDVVSLGAAIRTMQAMAGWGAVPTAWSEQLKASYDSLDKLGYQVLGDAPAPSEEANGPRSHISNHDLDTGDSDDISDAIAVFRRSDHL